MLSAKTKAPRQLPVRPPGPEQVVSDYLAAFYTGDFDTARRLVADDFAFSGPFVQVDGADAFMASAEPPRRIVRGVRTVRQCHDGDHVSTLYEMNLEQHAHGPLALFERVAVGVYRLRRS